LKSWWVRSRQKAESRRQKAEGRRQKAEGRKQKAESGKQEAESGKQMEAYSINVGCVNPKELCDAAQWFAAYCLLLTAY